MCFAQAGAGISKTGPLEHQPQTHEHDNGEKEENESIRRGQRSEVRAVLVLVVPGLVAERASLDLRVGELLPRVDVEARPGHAHQRSAVLSAAACSARILNTQNGLLAT